jgi:hypothetical protein
MMYKVGERPSLNLTGAKIITILSRYRIKKKSMQLKVLEKYGEPCRIRTCDPLIKSQLLYQLS